MQFMFGPEADATTPPVPTPVPRRTPVPGFGPLGRDVTTARPGNPICAALAMGPTDHFVVINPFPLGPYSGLVVPFLAEHRPQVMAVDALRVGMAFAANTHHIRVGYSKHTTITHKNGAPSGFETWFAPSTVGAGGPNQNTCVCGLVPGVPTKTRASRIQHKEF